jgi:DNA-binding transcriptional MerR regulator
MKDLPIRYVSQATGLTIDCIRSWEKRYGAIVPERKEGRRLYTEQEVQRLRLLKEAVTKGWRISQLATMEDGEIMRLIAQRFSPLDNPEGQKKVGEAAKGRVEALLYLLRQDAFEEVMDQLKRQAGLMDSRQFVGELLLPLLHAVGDAWAAKQLDIAQEHFLSFGVRNLMGTLLNVANVGKGPKIIFAAPSGHLHEFGLLAAALIATTRGFRPYYLGVDLPLSSLELAQERLAASLIVLAVMPALIRDDFFPELKAFKERLQPGTGCFLGGPADEGLASRLQAWNISYFSSLDQFELALGHLFTSE